MKKNFLLLALFFAFSLVLSSCKKDDDPAPPPVVGRWTADRIVLSGLSGDFQVYNNSFEPAFLGFTSTLNLSADKKFTYRNSTGATITSGNGTWEYSGTTLTLNYEDDTETLTYDQAKQELASPAEAVTLTLPHPTTEVNTRVNGQFQLFYAKQ